MIDTVIFDLDGTLLNTLEDLKNSTNFALSEFGFPKRSLEEVRSFVGNGVRKLIERAVPQSCDKETTEKCLEIFKKNYSENMYNNTAPYNSILEILKDLRNNGLKIGVVSNKFDSAVKELCKNILKIWLILQSVKPVMFLKTCSRRCFKSNKTSWCRKYCLCRRFRGGCSNRKNANIPCIGVTWGFRDKKI